jgi:hypothetical protein
MNKSPFALSYLPLLIRLQCQKTTRLPLFLGSTMHGIMGWALKRYSPEAYSYLFENKRMSGGKQDIVNPYFIEPPKSKSHFEKGELLTFTFVLVGNAIHYADAVINALRQSRTFGLGAQRAPFILKDILHGTQFENVYSEEGLNNLALKPENIHFVSGHEHATWCSLHLLTPLRIRRNGKLVEDITFPTIIRNITKRIEMLTERYGGHINTELATSSCEIAQSIDMTVSALHLSQMHRFSNRKNESMDWSGMLGALQFEGELSTFIPWLKAAQVLHIGRNSTFGCGKIDLIYL